MDEAPNHSMTPDQPLAARRMCDGDCDAVDAALGEPTTSGRPADPQRVAKMQALLNLAGQYPAPTPPSDLVTRTISRAHQAVARERVIEAVDAGRGPIFSFGWAQMATYAALVLVGLSLGWPSFARFREDARQIACQTHLGNVGAAFAQYSDDYDQALPRLSTAAGIPWWNVGQRPATEGAPVESNSAHLYLLARQGYADPHLLTCPSNEHAPLNMSRSQHDWSSAREVSYSYQNQYTAEAINPNELPGMAVLADKNPLFVAGASNGLRYDQTQAPDTASRFHDSRGQNVLRNDGTVLWHDQPVINDDDNIWLINGVRQYSGRERPESNSDSFLVP